MLVEVPPELRHLIAEGCEILSDLRPELGYVGHHLGDADYRHHDAVVDALACLECPHPRHQIEEVCFYIHEFLPLCGMRKGSSGGL
ncbi:hypothetical protein [Nonomuraea sp. NPDC050786]|uniref:hypothetical protein n=1 Tax=Nonomuraea sp. NPDC050786 TaxID=3154840 RepID=UPI003405677D